MDQQFTDELTALLAKLKKGHRVDMGKVIHSLSDVEREIFMKAMDQKNKKQRVEFEEMIKDEDQICRNGTLPLEGSFSFRQRETHPYGCFMWVSLPNFQVVGVPSLKWGSYLDWNNAVEGKVNGYRLAGGHLGSVVFPFGPLSI